MGGVGDDTLSKYFFDEGETNLAVDDLFAIFESLDSVIPLDETAAAAAAASEARLVSQKSTSSSVLQESDETDQLIETLPKSKRQKTAATTAVNSSDEATNTDGQQRMSHITVERNRRKQMNEHLSVLRSLMPCFYVKRVST